MWQGAGCSVVLARVLTCPGCVMIQSHVAKRYKTTLYLSWLACVVCFVDLSIVSPTLYPYVAKVRA